MPNLCAQTPWIHSFRLPVAHGISQCSFSFFSILYCFNIDGKLPKLRRENAELKKDKADLETNVAETIQHLQSQMATAVKVAIEKTSVLQMELNASQRRNEELERQIIELQNSRVRQVDHTAE